MVVLLSRRAREALMLREDLMKSRQAERLAKQKLMEMTSSPDFFSVSGRKLVVIGCIHNPVLPSLRPFQSQGAVVQVLAR